MAIVSSVTVCQGCSCILEQEDHEKGSCKNCGTPIPVPRPPQTKTRFSTPVGLIAQFRSARDAIEKQTLLPKEKEEQIAALEREFMTVLREASEEEILSVITDCHYMLKGSLIGMKNPYTQAKIIAHAKQLAEIATAVEAYKKAVSKVPEVNNG